MTREEKAREAKELKKWIKARTMTRKKFNAICREIMASDESDERKVSLVKSEAENYLDDSSHRFPEIRAIEAKQFALENEHAGTSQRPIYCRTCGTWTPAPPLKWVNLCRAWSQTKRGLIKKAAASILKKKAA